MQNGRARAVHFLAAVLGLLLPVAALAQNLPANVAVKTLEAHQALIDHRRKGMDALYSQQGTAEVTLREALQKGGVSEATINSYAHDWAGLGIGSDYTWARKSFYDAHDAALAQSISNVNARGVVSPAEMAQVDDGMTRWKVYEPGLRRLFEERVGLFVESGKAEDMKDSAEAMNCQGDPACERVKKGILDAADAAADKLSETLGENRDAITRASEISFFSAIKGAAPAKVCDTLALGYNPRSLAFGKTAYPQLTFGPQGCRPDGYPTFKLISSAGAKFELNISTGTVTKTDNLVGIAIVEAATETLGPVRAQIDGDAAPACTALEWTAAPNSIHLGAYSYVALAFKPDGCFATDMKIAVSADKPDVLWVSGAGTAWEIFGKAKGVASLSASAGTLRAAAKTVEVLNDGEPCKSLIFAYKPDVLRIGTRRVQTGAGGTVPEVQHLPDGCKIPEGNISFRVSSLDGQIVKLDTATGGVEGLTAGSALIVAQRGDVFGEARVRVEERPKCDLLVVQYKPNPVAVGATSSPSFRYANLAGGRQLDDPDAQMCDQPKARLIYSSSDPSRLPVDEAGVVTAKATGGALITVKPVTEKPDDPSDVVEITATQ